MSDIAIRWSGLLLIVGAALHGVGRVILSFTPELRQPLPPLANLLLFLSALVLLLSLPAMYARQAHAAGWSGLLGHALLQMGIVLILVATSPPLLYSAFDRPFEDSLTALLLGLALILGLLITGLATLRAGVYPKGAGILMLVATVGSFFGFFIAELLPRGAGQVGDLITGILLALALAWIGLSMWMSPRPAA